MKLDFESLYEEAHADAFNGAKKRFYDNRITELSLLPQDGKTVIKGIAVGAKNHAFSITFDEQGGLYDYTCDCGRNFIADGPCKHILAGALSFEDKNPSAAKKEEVGKKSDPAAIALISALSKFRRKRNESGGEELFPILCFIGGAPFLKLKIGKRRYKIKNIDAFLNNVEREEFHRYGIELGFYHDAEAFSESSRKLIRLLQKSRKERGIVFKDVMPLTQNDLDLFLDLYDGKLLPVEIDGCDEGARIVKCREYAPKIRLSVKKAEGGYALSAQRSERLAAEGRQSDYLLTENAIYRCSESYMRMTDAVTRVFAQRQTLFVADADMPTFYNAALLPLSEFADFESDTDLASYEAPPLTAKLYIDCDENGVNATLKCRYDDAEIDLFSDFSSGDVMRDWETERELKETLVKYFPDTPYMHVEDEAEIYRLLSEGVQAIFRYAEVYLSDDSRLKLRRSPRIRVGVRLKSDLLEVTLSEDELDNADLSAVLGALDSGKTYVRLDDGSFVNLTDEALMTLRKIKGLTGANGTEFVLPKYYAPFLDNEFKEGFFGLERDGSFKKLIDAVTAYAEKDVPVPDSLKSVMRNYQKAGYRWLKALDEQGFGGILADDMGLGKSLQIISLLLDRRGGTSIIVCPTTLILNWMNEFAKFAPELNVLAIYGSKEERARAIEKATDYDVIVTSYELLRRDAALYKFDFTFAVADEAQYIKNPDTQNAAAVKSLRAARRFALTGTPIENSLCELWSIFDFIMPGYLGSYSEFKDKFEYDIIHGSIYSAEELVKLTSPFILRRMKSNVLKELPPKIETDIFCPLEGVQRELYAQNLALARQNLGNDGAKNRVMVLAQLTRLRQICCEPRLLDATYAGNSAKTDACLDLISTAIEGGHKLLVFSQFASLLELLREKLTERGITHFLLKGDTPKQERMRNVNRFNKDETKVFLVSLRAGGTGLNLVGADVVIHYDPWWNESVMNQATDRAYRIGQTKSVQVYRLIMKDSLEEKILSLQKRKTVLSNLMVDGGNITTENLMKLLD